jgi:hypothetical protein
MGKGRGRGWGGVGVGERKCRWERETSQATPPGRGKNNPLSVVTLCDIRKPNNFVPQSRTWYEVHTDSAVSFYIRMYL